VEGHYYSVPYQLRKCLLDVRLTATTVEFFHQNRLVTSHPLGPPGVGKTHLAVGIGLKACALGHRTVFTTAAGLIGSLVRAHQENRIEEKIKLLVQPKLVIIYKSF
jgi:DNA replication protein DnaC